MRRALKLAYLINQYPKVSHTFIRREILALEKMGQPVERYTLRRVNEKLADPADLVEEARTKVVLEAGAEAHLLAVARTAARDPRRFVRALRLALRLGVTSDVGLARHLIYLAEACVLLGWLRRDEIEHVHAHFGTNSTTVAMLAHALGGPTYSFTAHGPEEFDRPFGIGLGEKIRRALFVAGVSSFGQSQLFRQTSSDAWGRIGVVRCGVDGLFLTEQATPVPDNQTLVMVARLSPEKGQFLLVEAVRRLRDQLRAEGRTFRVVLVGDGPSRGAIETFIAQHGLGDVVSITGWCSGEEVKRHVVGARAMVLPSFAEGLPVVIMEALALGRPVLSTYIAGIPELVVPGECGWLVPAGAIEPLVTTMREVLDTPVQRLTEMGLAGRRRVAAQHDIEATARSLLDQLRARL